MEYVEGMSRSRGNLHTTYVQPENREREKKIKT